MCLQSQSNQPASQRCLQDLKYLSIFAFEPGDGLERFFFDEQNVGRIWSLEFKLHINNCQSLGCKNDGEQKRAYMWQQLLLIKSAKPKWIWTKAVHGKFQTNASSQLTHTRNASIYGKSTVHHYHSAVQKDRGALLLLRHITILYTAMCNNTNGHKQPVAWLQPKWCFVCKVKSPIGKCGQNFMLNVTPE